MTRPPPHPTADLRGRLLRRAGTLAALLAVLLASGSHWVAFQAFAFGSMLVRYAQDAPWREALRQTFDGEHPCPLCHAVQQGRQQEEEQRPRLGLGARVELAPVPPVTQVVWAQRQAFELPAVPPPVWRSRSYPPPKPPPRAS